MGSTLRNLLGAAVVAGAISVAPSAHAATVGTISNAVLGNAYNDGLAPIGFPGTISGWFGADLYLIGGPATISISYLGKDASYNNSFTFGGTFFTGPASSFVPATGTPILAPVGVNPSALPLAFSFTSGGAGEGSVVNGSNVLNTLGLVNFFVSFGDPAVGNPGHGFDGNNDPDPAFGGTVAYLWLDDDRNTDDNHDDMVIRLAVTGGSFSIDPPGQGSNVPLPGGLALLAGGLGVVGLLTTRRRRKKSA